MRGNPLILPRGGRVRQRQGDEERRALAGARFTADGAAQRLDAIRDNSEPEAGAADAELAVQVRVGAEETVEDRRLIGLVDSQSVVTDTDGARAIDAGSGGRHG